MSKILEQGTITTIRFVESLIKLSDGARLVTGATVRVCIDGTWGAGAGTLAIDETDQWKYTLHSTEAAARELEIAIDHADAVGPIGGSFTLLAPGSYDWAVEGGQTQITRAIRRYNNTLNLGTGLEYTSIDTANTASAAGDLLRIHAGSHTANSISKDDVDIELMPGAILTTTGTSTMLGASRLNIFGRGTLAGVDDAHIAIITANKYINIECDTIDAQVAAEAFEISNSGILRLKVRRLLIGSFLADNISGEMYVEANEIETADFLTQITGGLSVIHGENITLPNTTTIAGTAGTLILSGNVNCTHATTPGIEVPAGCTVICRNGSVRSTLGRPHFTIASGGILRIEPSFSCDPSRITDNGGTVEFGAVGSVTGNVGGSVASVVGAVGSVTAAVTVGTINAGVITATSIASGALTAAKFASGAFDAVWSVASRILSAGTNIVLAKGTGVTGFNDLSAAQVNAEVDTAISDADLATATAVSDLVVDVAQLGQSISESFDELPSAAANADAVWDEPKAGHVTANTFGAFIDQKISEVEGGSGTPRPVNQTPVPSARTWVLKPTDDGLQGELPLSATTGDSGKVWAIDFRHDLANNGRLVSVDAVTLITGTSGGITFGNDINDVDDYGVDRSQAKVRIGLVTAGTYEFRVHVSYDPADGGGTSQGEVKLIVK